MYRGGGEEEKEGRKGGRESKGQQRRDTNILHFMRKRNYALYIAKRGGGLKRPKKK
jgi:hypothetical protein